MTKKHMGYELKARRREEDFSLVALASRLGIDPSTISRREVRETSHVFISWLQHFIELEIDPIEFFGLKKEPVKDPNPIELSLPGRTIEKQQKTALEPKIGGEW